MLQIVKPLSQASAGTHWFFSFLVTYLRISGAFFLLIITRSCNAWVCILVRITVQYHLSSFLWYRMRLDSISNLSFRADISSQKLSIFYETQYKNLKTKLYTSTLIVRLIYLLVHVRFLIQEPLGSRFRTHSGVLIDSSNGHLLEDLYYSCAHIIMMRFEMLNFWILWRLMYSQSLFTITCP